MTILQPLHGSNGSLVRCSTCGTALTAFLAPDTCPVCRLTQEATRRAPSDVCPLCRSTRVLRTEAIDERGEQMCLCSHCNHIWSAGLI